MAIHGDTQKQLIECLARWLLKKKSRAEIREKWLENSSRNSIFREQLRAELNRQMENNNECGGEVKRGRTARNRGED